MNMNVYQHMADGWARERTDARSKSQLTLGALISALEAMPPETRVSNICGPHSYRGYYSDLAFEQKSGTRPASELLAECRAAMGKTFEGYKSGDYMMGDSTPLWIAHYGCCGTRLMDMRADGTIRTEDEP